VKYIRPMNSARMEAFSDGVIAIIIKGNVSPILHALGVLLAFRSPGS
jgi:hypothetical protein